MPIGALASSSTLDRIPAISTVLRRELRLKGPLGRHSGWRRAPGDTAPQKKVGQGNHAAQRRGAYAKNGKLCELMMDSCNAMTDTRFRND